MTSEITLQQAAEQLGVHYMTAYRYVRLGLLPARKEGAAWRVRSRDVSSFRATRPGGRAAGAPRRARWPERLADRLVEGDAGGAWGVTEAALAAGTSVPELYVEVFATAMELVGERWERGEIDVAAEHRATAGALRLLGRMAPRIARRGRSRGCFVLGTVAGERHGLPAALVADLARHAGFDVAELGSDIPVESFAATVARVDRPVAVGISASTRDGAAVRRTIKALREVSGELPILLGGRAIADEAAALKLGADAWAADGYGAVALLEDAAAGRLVHR